MNITIVQAYIITEESKRRLTLAAARQFPIRGVGNRARRLEHGERVEVPLCKIAGSTLKNVAAWLYLVPDKTSGYAWVQVNELYPGMAETIEQRGGSVDVPADVPIVLL